MKDDGLLAGKHVVVVGGGPGGCMAAAQAAKQGGTVDVYDANPVEGSGAKQWVIALGPMSVKAMKALNLSTDMGEHTRPSGTTIHAPGGKAPVYKRGIFNPETPIYDMHCMASRDEITGHLWSEAKRVYGARLRQHWSTRLVEADVLTGRLVFEPREGAQFEVQADLIIGADGAGSVVRQQLQQQVEGFAAERRICADTATCFAVPAPLDNALHCLETPSGEAFNHFPPHLQTTSCVLPGASLGFIAPERSANAGLRVCALVTWPQQQGMAMVVFVWPKWWELKLDEEAAYREVAKAFPRLPKAFARQAASELRPGNPNTRSLSHVTCNSLGGGRAIIVGDAAHCIPPSIGMGCNAAIADGAELGEAIEKAGGDIAQLPAVWTRIRLAEVNALVSAAEGTYWLSAPRRSTKLSGVWDSLPWLAISLASIPGLNPPYTFQTFVASAQRGDSIVGAVSSLRSYLLRTIIGATASVVLVFAVVIHTMRRSS